MFLARADASKAHPKSGLLQLEWSKVGDQLLARFGTRPAYVRYTYFSTLQQYLRNMFECRVHLLVPLSVRAVCPKVKKCSPAFETSIAGALEPCATGEISPVLRYRCAVYVE